jgi:hypothetical protein
MLNLYSFEQRVLDRRTEMRKEALRRSLLKQAAESRDGLVSEPAVGSSIRSSIALLLVRLGQRLDSEALPQQRLYTRQCVCVPVGN